ncbi:hypothetical protein ACTFIW_003565 [Dictyostelium discoideum]
MTKNVIGSITKNLETVFGTIAKRKSKGENLLDVCFSLPSRGVGNKFAKMGWTEKDTYWTVTKTKFNSITCTNSSLKGQAYGILTWGGKTDTKERKIDDAFSKDWTIYPAIKFPTAAEPVVETVITEENLENPQTEEQQQQN